MTTTSRALIATALIGTTIVLAAYGDRLGQAITFGAIGAVTIAQHTSTPPCRPDEPTIYLAGTHMTGCPSRQ